MPDKVQSQRANALKKIVNEITDTISKSSSKLLDLLEQNLQMDASTSNPNTDETGMDYDTKQRVERLKETLALGRKDLVCAQITH